MSEEAKEMSVEDAKPKRIFYAGELQNEDTAKVFAVYPEAYANLTRPDPWIIYRACDWNLPLPVEIGRGETEEAAWIDAAQRILSAPQEPSVEQMEADLRVKFPEFHVCEYGNTHHSPHAEPRRHGWDVLDKHSFNPMRLGSGATREAAIRDAWERHCKPSGVDLGDEYCPGCHFVNRNHSSACKAKHRVALPPEPAPKCGKPAASFIPRWGMFFVCVLEPNHEGECQQGGTCFKHGEYVGLQCSRFPDCLPDVVPAPQSEVETPKPEICVVCDQTIVALEDAPFPAWRLERNGEVSPGNHWHHPKVTPDPMISSALPEEPKPQDDGDVSGKFLLRTGKSLHLKLKALAGCDDLSLNQYITGRLWEIAGGRPEPIKLQNKSSTPSSPAVSGTERERFEAWGKPEDSAVSTPAPLDERDGKPMIVTPTKQWLVIHHADHTHEQVDNDIEAIRRGDMVIQANASEMYCNQLRLRMEQDDTLRNLVQMIYVDIDGKRHDCVGMTEEDQMRWPKGFLEESFFIEAQISDLRIKRRTGKTHEGWQASLSGRDSSVVPERSDVERLEWLEGKEAHLMTHREKLGEGYGIWWNVVKRNKSLSGHPLGSPRAAIDAAMDAASSTSTHNEGKDGGL